MKYSREVIRFVIIRTIGNFLVLFAVYGMIMTFGPALYQEARYRYNGLRNIHYVVAAVSTKAPQDKDHGRGDLAPTSILPSPSAVPTIEQHTFFGQIAGGDKVETIVPVSTEFGIVIPKIGANAPIYPNVNAGKADEYLEVLQKGVAHAIGTVFPGVPGNIFLFAHSTDTFWNVNRYNAIFFLLKELEKDDEIDVFYLGVRHVYRVVDKIIVDPSEVHYLTDPINHEQLTLQTCWPPGTTLKRMLVIARPEADLK